MIEFLIKEFYEILILARDINKTWFISLKIRWRILISKQLRYESIQKILTRKSSTCSISQTYYLNSKILYFYLYYDAELNNIMRLVLILYKNNITAFKLSY